MSGQFFVTMQTQTFKVTLSWGSEIGWGRWTAASPQALQPLEGPTRRCLSHRSYHSSHLWAAGRWTAAATGPTLPASPFLTPSCIRDLGRGAWEVERLKRTTWPRRLRTPSPNRVTRLPQRGARCAPPRRPRAASPRAAGDETSGAHYRRGRGLGAGRGRGLELVPKLTCSPAGGWRRRGRGESASPGVSGAALASPPSPCPTSPRSCAVGLTVPGAVPVPGLGAGET